MTTDSRSNHFARLADILADVRYGQQRMLEANRIQLSTTRNRGK